MTQDTESSTNSLIVSGRPVPERYVSLPIAVMTDLRLSAGARLLYGLLLDYAWHSGHCWPGQAILAEQLGVSGRTIQNWLTELRQREYIRCLRRGLGQTNVYILRLGRHES